MSKYNIGLLNYGSIFYDHRYLDLLKNSDNTIYNIQGPFVPIRLSGLAFPSDENNIKLTRNLHPLGEFIRSTIYIFKTNDIGQAIKQLSKREYYDSDDIEPICYYKMKSSNNNVLKLPIYTSNIKLLKNYNYMNIYLDHVLNKYCKKLNLDYILFISYDHRINLLNIDHTFNSIKYQTQLKEYFNNTLNKTIILNTQAYLKMCDPNTLSDIEIYILSITF